MVTILSKQSLVLNRKIWDFWVFLTKGVGEKEHGRVLLFSILVGGYMKDSLKGSIISFWDFHLQGYIQAFPICTLLF